MTEEEFERDSHAVSNDLDKALDAHFTFEALNNLAKNDGSRVWTADPIMPRELGMST
jgi:hypothetical protein